MFELRWQIMKTVELGPWVYCLNDGDNQELKNKEKVGKWMHFHNNVDFADKICHKAIEENIVVECKYTNAPTGVCCFYINYDDIEAHKRVINFFIKNNLIRKTKTGKFFNISFKLDSQTRNREYANSGFKSEIKLAEFINLETGEWIYK